jgi:hypothetical protein
MATIPRRTFVGAMIAAPLIAQNEDWSPLFNGTSLDGWRANQNPATWSVRDGAIETNGARSHLFYQGRVANAKFKNFELKAEVMTRPNSNGGIFFHTALKPGEFPAQGFEVQVFNTKLGPGGSQEPRKTGSLIGIRNIYKSLAADDEWIQMHVLVRGKNVQVRVNNTLVVDYIEPTPPVIVGKEAERVLGTGTFALQAHDPGARVRYRNIMVRPLPDGEPTPVSEAPAVDDLYRMLLRLSGQAFPLVDFHVHLKDGWTLEEALQNSRSLGIQYGIAANCGMGFPISDEKGALEFLASMKNKPVFAAMQGEGREWVKTFSPEVISQFDYVITDSMTFTDDRGKRMRIWLDDEVGEIPDKQQFMNVIVDRTVGVLNSEPIDIYVNPTFLPTAIAADYDELWTQERMAKVIEAARKNRVAIEINSRFRIPSPQFIKLAKQAGLRFAFGTNNENRRIGRLKYCLDMVDECGLEPQHMFMPAPEGEKPIQRRLKSAKSSR